MSNVLKVCDGLHTEIRMKERVFMGIGHKPFMDITPSEMAINDRAINCALTGRGKTRFNIVNLTQIEM